jgi:phenylalanyl-tRNA synthetase alpha chain
MIEKIQKLIEEADAFSTQSLDELETFRIKFLGKKGLLTDLFASFKEVPNEQKKDFGQEINKLKSVAQEKVNSIKTALENSSSEAALFDDLTRPGEPFNIGARHPISLVKNQITEIFSRIGFNVSEGPEIEDDWHNFTALNLPEHHPARDMQDTFFIQTDPDILLRTHTSSVQVRYMENNQPPIRTISPGRVYRNEAISARSHCFFHQVEGLYIDKNVSFSEVDVYWGLETETDYKMTKGTGWLEIMGCGMVDPNVLENCGIDSKEYSGFAFGMGIDRIALLLHQISDIRLLSENNVRFLEQFKSHL